jgi:putative membrane protein
MGDGRFSTAVIGIDIATQRGSKMMKYPERLAGLSMLAAVVLVSMMAAAPAVAQPSFYGPHMWGGGWGMLFGPLTMILLIAAVVAVVVLLARWLSGTRRGGYGSPPGKTPLDILQERFARGEIDKEEFEERRRVLNG